MKKEYKAIDYIVISVSITAVLLLTAIGFFWLLFGIAQGNGIKNRMRADEMHPSVQPGTVWLSKDEKITLKCIPEGDDVIMPVTVDTDFGPIELELTAWLVTGEVWFKVPGENGDEEASDTSIAHGSGKCKDYDEFIIKISSADEIFEPGEKIVFYRISAPEP